MTSTEATAIIDLASFIITNFSAAMIASYRVGKVEGKIQSDLNYLKLQIAEIKGMFVLRLRDDGDKQ